MKNRKPANKGRGATKDEPIIGVRFPLRDRKRLELVQVERGDDSLSVTVREALYAFIERHERRRAA